MPQALAKYILTAEDRTDRAFRSVNKRFSDAAERAAKFSATIGALAGGAFAEFGRRAFFNAEAIARLSRDLGVSTENLSEMQSVLRRLGLPFEGYIDGVRTMQERLQELTDGTPSVVAAFERIGLSARDFRDKTPDEALRLLIERLEDTEDVTKRNATALEIFGDEAGKVFIRLAETGADRIAKMRREADRLGLSIDERQASKVFKFGESLRFLGEVFLGAINQTVLDNMDSMVQSVRTLIEFAPQLLKFAAGLTRFIGQLLQFAERYGQFGVDQIETGGRIATQAFQAGRNFIGGQPGRARERLDLIGTEARDFLARNLDLPGMAELADLLNIDFSTASEQRRVQIDIQRRSATALERVVTGGIPARAG